MNPIAAELNRMIETGNPFLMDMLSSVGRQLFFPKGILTQSAEAKEKAHHINATAGIAKENNHTMCLASTTRWINDLKPSESLTYAPSYGIPALRELWRKSLYAKNPSLDGKTVSLPVVTCGITHGVSVFADMWVDPGDVILLPDLMWGNYNMIFKTRKSADIRHYPIFTASGDYHIDAFETAVRDACQQQAKIIVMLNFPHNPSGYTISEAEAAATVNILTAQAEAGTQVIAVTDDSYFGLFYEETSIHESLFARLAGQHPRLLAVKLDGCTKENFVWGLRVGFMTYGARIDDDVEAVYEALEKKTAGCVRGTISNASHLSQSIVLKSMQDSQFASEKAEKFHILKARAQRVKQVLENKKFQTAWDVYPFNSGYFMCLKLKHTHAEALRQHLLNKYGIGLIAIGEQNLRVAFSCVEETQIPELFEIIYKGVADLSS